jgi:hypothetical protein
LITIVQATVTEYPLLSVTSMLKLNVPSELGVPVMAPVDGFSVRPGGNEPLAIEKVYGGVPPVATAADEYARPTVPVFAGQTSFRSGGLMTMLQFDVAVPAALPVESTTWAVKLNVPAVVGVPVMAPVDELSVKPAGNEPVMIENVYGGTPPVATSDEL